MKITLITGGVRSGKSVFAEKMAHSLGGDSVLYVATGQAWDEEMRQRIALHQKHRPNTWDVVEEGLDMHNLLRMESLPRVVLLDTLSGWITNLLFTYSEDQWGSSETRAAIVKCVVSFIETLTTSPAKQDTTWILVSDEVGLGGVAMSTLGRAFQDITGKVHQEVANVADEVYFVVSGLPMKLKGGVDR